LYLLEQSVSDHCDHSGYQGFFIGRATVTTSQHPDTSLENLDRRVSTTLERDTNKVIIVAAGQEPLLI